MIKNYKWLALCLLGLIVLPALGAAQQVSLTIFHTNDTHGHLLPFSSLRLMRDQSSPGSKNGEISGGSPAGRRW